MNARAWILVGGLGAAGLAAWWIARPDHGSGAAPAAAPAQGSVSTTNAKVTSAQLPEPLPDPGAQEPTAQRVAGPMSPADPEEAPYPVDLEELRARLPNNRYWELGVPTRDPAVAQARAERAKRDNETFGRTQTGEATEAEIRGYYAERRRISEDYLQLSELVLAEKKDQLSDRDLTLFALSAKLHKERLVQIERDLADALARRKSRP